MCIIMCVCTCVLVYTHVCVYICVCVHVCVCVAVTAVCFWQYYEVKDKDEEFTIHMGIVMTFSKEKFFLTTGLCNL